MKIIKILRALNKADMVLADIFGGVGSRKTAWRDILYPGWEGGYMKDKNIDSLWQKERDKFLKLMNYLVEKGLVQKKEGRSWKITQKGKEYFKKIAGKNLMPIKIEESGLKKDWLKIVIFDIPETERKKRFWVRQSLVNMDFEMLQKSVWIGETKLPYEFFKEMAELKIMKYVHIFAVKEKGSIGFGE